MSIFGFGKREEKKGCCAPEAAQSAGEAVCSVKILGGGCAKCNQLEAATVEALGELGMDARIEHVRDFAEIAAYGVMTTPALVVDGKFRGAVIVSGLPHLEDHRCLTDTMAAFLKASK